MFCQTLDSEQIKYLHKKATSDRNKTKPTLDWPSILLSCCTVWWQLYLLHNLSQFSSVSWTSSQTLLPSNCSQLL